MILTDREIKIAIERGLIRIEPPPTADKYSSTSVDLTLDKSINVFKQDTPGVNTSIDFAKIQNHEDALLQISEHRTICPEDGYKLEPKRLILAWTNERLDLKAEARIAARVEGKSSLARFGLGIHITAPTIHSGFKGRIQLEIINHGPTPVTLRENMKVCQLIFEQTLGTPEKGYQGQFQGQRAS